MPGLALPGRVLVGGADQGSGHPMVCSSPLAFEGAPFPKPVVSYVIVVAPNLTRLVKKLTLLRRVTIDLTGLPPTPEETQAFLGDRSPAAYEKVVDRLLASPAYGERWARHGLDVARYADSDGFKADAICSITIWRSSGPGRLPASCWATRPVERRTAGRARVQARYGREPASEELKVSVAFLDSQASRTKGLSGLACSAGLEACRHGGPEGPHYI